MSSINNSHVDFAQSMIGGQIKLGSNTQKYLVDKHKSFQDECAGWDKGEAAGKQAGHILKLPYTVGCLVTQTIVDTIMVAALAIFNIFSLGLCKELRQDFAARSYNLFVADTITWLSLPPSVFCYLAYEGANSLHLGTTRQLDFA